MLAHQPRSPASAVSAFGPGDPEWCAVGDPADVLENAHCGHWYKCEPCHWCGDDTPDPSCDCPRCTAARGFDLDSVTVERADNGAWWVVIDGRRVSDHRGHEAARIAARRHQGIDTERAR